VSAVRAAWFEQWTDGHTGELLMRRLSDETEYHDPGDEDRGPCEPPLVIDEIQHLLQEGHREAEAAYPALFGRPGRYP
jgi:hypothetical protein